MRNIAGPAANGGERWQSPVLALRASVRKWLTSLSLRIVGPNFTLVERRNGTAMTGGALQITRPSLKTVKQNGKEFSHQMVQRISRKTVHSPTLGSHTQRCLLPKDDPIFKHTFICFWIFAPSPLESEI